MKPTFKSRENKVHIVNGKEIWESRSTAVGAVILGIYKDNVFVLAEKRSQKMPDGKGLWVVPSGYINYDENGWDAMRRECYEETSFFIDKYKKYVVFDNDKESFYTHTNPSENRQNIVVWFCIVYDFSKRDDLPREVESYVDEEVDKVRWIPVKKVFDFTYKWAFKHNERIEQAITKFEKYLNK
jgi:8-oxo-dGTP pyrophosphatase MutT (NUDIX family)